MGFEDEVWWSRYEQPRLHAWADIDRPLRLVEQSVAKEDKAPKALACYGLLVQLRQQAEGEVEEQMWLRFVAGRPVSAITTQFLDWCCQKLEAVGKSVLLLVWDNASWHKSKAVREWIRAHNRRVKTTGKGVRILPCLLPSKSPWLNPIEPRWMHGKRKVCEPDGVLTAEALEARVCKCFGCNQEDHLAIPENVT